MAGLDGPSACKYTYSTILVTERRVLCTDAPHSYGIFQFGLSENAAHGFLANFRRS
jgi:hypothetical protein